VTLLLPGRTSVQKYAVGRVEKPARLRRLGLGRGPGGGESRTSGGPTVLKAQSCQFKINFKPSQCSLDIVTTAHRRTDSEVVVPVTVAAAPARSVFAAAAQAEPR
jgi:hypothetical protein